MYTHVCIQTAKPSDSRPEAIIKKGMYCTLKSSGSTPKVTGKDALEFEEDKGIWYSAYLFLPLPPQKEKTVYVAVSEEIVKQIEEPVLN